MDPLGTTLLTRHRGRTTNVKQRRLISFDWALKRLLRNKANFAILEGFLSELLKEDISIQEILESESNKEDRRDKYNRVDIKVSLPYTF